MRVRSPPTIVKSPRLTILVNFHIVLTLLGVPFFYCQLHRVGIILIAPGVWAFRLVKSALYTPLLCSTHVLGGPFKVVRLSTKDLLVLTVDGISCGRGMNEARAGYATAMVVIIVDKAKVPSAIPKSFSRHKRESTLLVDTIVFGHVVELALGTPLGLATRIGVVESGVSS